jgi:ATP-dependent RNA helicase SUPV3L1/SUV3
VPPVEATRSAALLGPTNTGKTHRAVERMLEHATGMIGLPLRLLAREIYDRVSARIGEDEVALVTGEEKRVPRRPRYWVCTTEAMPLTVDVDFIAVDEIQLATHEERGHVFTDRLLSARGRLESWFLGSHTMSGIVEQLVPAAHRERHPRLSRLSYSGQCTLARLPPRSAVVAFSLPELYALAGRLRALRGGAALVLGALSPRARNAQVAMFQAGEVDYLVATDAVGMGLNLDVSHVAFASLRKFDGRNARSLEGAELAQIAGRAGRYLRDGTFGTLSPLELPQDLAASIEQHQFDPVRRVRYRNSALDFSSAESLIETLEARPPLPCLNRVADAVDARALKVLLADPALTRSLGAPGALELLWSVCVIPDYRRILFDVHVELLRELYQSLLAGPLSDDFMRARVVELEQGSDDADNLLARLARLRTWAFVVNHGGWVASQELWRSELDRLEVRLSDALHEALVGSFVEQRGRRTARARPAPRRASIVETDAAPVDRHHPFAVLERWRGQVQQPALETPAERSQIDELLDAPHAAFRLDDLGQIHAGALKLGALSRGSSLTLPDVRLAALEVAPGARLRLHRRVLAFVRDTVSRFLEPIGELGSARDGGLRAIAYHLEQGLGSARARDLAASLAALDESARAVLASKGVVLGELAVFMPGLLGRAALARRALLTRVFESVALPEGLGCPQLDAASLAPETWLSLGYLVLGARACRIDLAERAARALACGEPSERALRCLSLPRREQQRVARAIAAASRAPALPRERAR